MIIERLSQEHRNIEKLLAILEQELEAFGRGDRPDYEVIRAAIPEAVQQPSTRCAPVKTDDQLDLQALHRVRSRLAGQRTAVIQSDPRLSLGHLG